MGNFTYGNQDDPFKVVNVTTSPLGDRLLPLLDKISKQLDGLDRRLGDLEERLDIQDLS